MASNRKPGCNDGTVPVPERKRRRSDLVIMWQSVWDVTLNVVTELWISLLGIWYSIKIHINADKRQDIRNWLEKYFSSVPDDFAESWRDGVLLCILLNKLQPGCHPDAEKLDINYGLYNLYRAFHILETQFNIRPEVTVEEVLTCANNSDSKFLELLLELKQETDSRLNELQPLAHIDESEEDKCSDSTSSRNCIVKGSGLIVGFVGRAANFSVFCASMCDLDLVVEIKGPSDTICCERITKRSPKKKQPFKPWKPSSHRFPVVRSISNHGPDILYTSDDEETRDETEQPWYVPLEYEIHSNQINFAYIPLVKGQHIIKIISHGQYVSDSPYAVEIEPAVGPHKNTNVDCLKSALKLSNSHLTSEDTEPKEGYVRFQEPSERRENLGKIIKRRVLRYIVKINNKDVVVDTDSITNLATSLLKMDYELQKRPLSRRNSWGFVGDAERKVSAIRQFCVKLDDLEAQSAKLHRSHSLTTNSKKPFSKSSSYEYEDILQQKKLETVTEGTVSHFERSSLGGSTDVDEVFAYLNEDFDCDKEYPKAFEETDVEVEDEKMSNWEQLGKSVDRFIEKTLIESDVICDLNLSPQSNIEATTNSETVESHNFNIMISNNKPPDHLTCSNEDSGRLKVASPSIYHSIDDKNATSTELNSIFSYEMNRKDSLTTDNSECGCQTKTHNSNTMKLVSGCIQEDPEILKEDSISDDFLIEKPFTKTDIKSLNRSNYPKSRKVSVSNMTIQNTRYDDFTDTISKLAGTNMKETIDGTNSVGYFKNNHSKEPNLEVNSDVLSNVFGKVPKRNSFYSRRDKRISYSNMNRRKRNAKEYRKYFDNCLKTTSHYLSSFSNNDLIDFAKDYNKPPSKYVAKNPTKESSRFSDNNKMSTKTKGKDSFIAEVKDFELHSKKFQNSSRNKYSNFLFNQLNNENTSNRSDCLTDSSIKKISSHIIPNARKKYQNEYHSTKETYSNKKNSLSNTFSLLPDPLTPSLTQTNVFSPDTSNENSTESFPIKTHTLVSLGQFNFKHFNPSPPNNRNSLVKYRIKQWENTVGKDQMPESEGINILDSVSQLVNVTAKLKFWETVCEKNSQLGAEFQKDLSVLANSKFRETEEKVADTVQPDSTGEDIEMNRRTQKVLSPSSICPEQISPSINKTSAVSWKKPADDKLKVTLSTSKVRKRSFSDPCVLESSSQEPNVDVKELECFNEIANQTSSIESANADESSNQTWSLESSSNDANFLDYSSNDESISVDILYSTEDEYIDDEISESASTYWGDLSHMKCLKVPDTNEYNELCQVVDSEFFKEHNQRFQHCPAECKVFGIAIYFGYVAIKNRFRVLTKGSGSGNLSATVQGLGRHDVSFVSVRYTHRDIYEVTYQVMTPGLYLISVRWMESPIAGSPFLCKVTF